MKDLLILFLFNTLISYFMLATGLTFYNIKYKFKKILISSINCGITFSLVEKVINYYYLPNGLITIIIFIVFLIILKSFFLVDNIEIWGISLLSFSLMMIGSTFQIIVTDIYSIDKNITSSFIVHFISRNLKNIFLYLLFGYFKIFKVNIYTLLGEQ